MMVYLRKVRFCTPRVVKSNCALWFSNSKLYLVARFYVFHTFSNETREIFKIYSRFKFVVIDYLQNIVMPIEKISTVKITILAFGWFRIYHTDDISTSQSTELNYILND
jgi:hypothetical protein